MRKMLKAANEKHTVQSEKQKLKGKHISCQKPCKSEYNGKTS